MEAMLMIAPFSASDESGHRCVRQPRQRDDVEVYHFLHLVHVGSQQRRNRTESGVVDQHRDAAVRTQVGLDTCQVGLLTEVRDE
jgi:hypothetical protein